MFSHNGCWTFSGLLKNQRLPTPIKIIVDSAPNFDGFCRHLKNEHAVMTKLVTSLYLNKAQYYQYPFTPIASWFFLAWISLSHLTDAVVPFKYFFFTDYIELHKYYRDHFPVSPALFIFSKGDELISPQGVRTCMSDLAARHVPVSELELGDDVPHISGIYKQAHKYLSAVDQFFDLRGGDKREDVHGSKLEAVDR